MNIPKNITEPVIKALFYLFPILTVLRMMRGMGWVYYFTQTILLIFILIFAYSVIKNKIDFKVILNKNLLILYAFPVWATLTALWSINPASSVLKGLNFIFVVTGILAGILLLNTQDEKNILKYILPANIFVIVTSLFSVIFHFPADAWTIGHGLSFAGFFTHQNVLGMAVLFTLPGVLWLRAKGRGHSEENSYSWSFGHFLFNGKRQVLFFLILIFDFLIIILSYSRSVILAVIVFAVLWLVINKKKRILIFTGLLVIVILIIAVFNKTFEDELYKIAAKHPYSLFETRTILWEPSFEAAKIGGISGVGYGMNARGIYVLKTDSLRGKDVNFYREKGNLALAFIEETGIIGFVIFFAGIIYILIHLYQFKDKAMAQILFITIIALLVQSNFEGWSGGGSPVMQLFSIFLLIAVVELNNITVLKLDRF